MKVEKSSEVLSQEVNGETVLLDLRSESYFGLDQTATRIWQLLSEHDCVEDVQSAMLAEFDVDPDVLDRDLHLHLEQLEEAGLIRRVES